MSQKKPVPVYEAFPFLKKSSRLSNDLSRAMVVSSQINQAKTTLELTFSLTDPVPSFEISKIEDVISKACGVETVTVNPIYAVEVKHGSGLEQGDGSSVLYEAGQMNRPLVTSNRPPTPPKPIMGKVVKTKPKPMSDVTLDDGRVAVKGEVFAVRSRHIEKSNSWLLDFDITDYSGSINVSKFFRQDDRANGKHIINSIKKGMHLFVSGSLNQSKYDKELTLDPQNIFPYEAEKRTDDSGEKRIELHLHTKMSAMDALVDINEVIQRAAAWGHPAIAITDHGVVHSFPAAAKAAAKLKGKIKVIYGLEGYFKNDIDEKTADSSKKRYNHITILVKNRTGMKNLFNLITKSHLEYYETRPIIFKSILKQHREGLLIGSACESGEVYRAIVKKENPEILHKLTEFYDYLEIMPVCNNGFMVYGNNPKVKTEDDLRDLNRQVVELGAALNKPVVATGDVHFLEPEHEVYRRILLNSKGYSGVNDEMPLYFKTTGEMLKEFNYLGEETAYEVVIKNPLAIADMCENVSPMPVPEILYPPKLDGSAEDLNTIIRAKTLEYYGENPPDEVTERIVYELNDILRLNYDVIYMAAQKLVSFLKEQKSRVGSRGSVGSSLVAFLAGISEVNPLRAHYRCPNCKSTEFNDEFACGADMPDKSCSDCDTNLIKDGFNIPFETFMGFDGAKVPDIDLNISSEHQAQAHKYTIDMFGAQYVFRAGTIGTVGEKNAYRFAKTYLESIGRIASRAEENRLAGGCIGVKQTTGQHPGGLIVIPQDSEITDFCPAQYPANDSKKGVITLHYEYEYIEDNLIKLDILGHENPTMLRMLEGMTGINADDIQLDDAATMAIFSSPAGLGLPEDDKIIGETGSIGIPEFGTPFTREMLRDTRPDNFDTLVRLSGFSHGTGVWAGNAKELIQSRKATIAETIASREDIILFLVSKGMDKRYAFKISERLRKGLGLPDGAEQDMVSHGIPRWYIDSCKKIKYLFPKAHAVAYVMMAFRIAWFKVHKPLEFYSAHFYRRRESFDVDLMTKGISRVRSRINDLKNNTDQKSGKEEGVLTTLESCYEFYMRGYNFANIDLYESDAEKFLIVDEKTLRPPFIAVNGLGESAARVLAEQRKNHDFFAIDEILAACPGLNKTNLDKLKQLGALRDLPDSSQMSLF